MMEEQKPSPSSSFSEEEPFTSCVFLAASHYCHHDRPQQVNDVIIGDDWAAAKGPIKAVSEGRRCDSTEKTHLAGEIINNKNKAFCDDAWPGSGGLGGRRRDDPPKWNPCKVIRPFFWFLTLSAVIFVSDSTMALVKGVNGAALSSPSNGIMSGGANGPVQQAGAGGALPFPEGKKNPAGLTHLGLNLGPSSRAL